MTKYLSLFLALGLFATSVPAQTSCKCSLLLDPDYKGKIEVLSTPGGKLIKSIQHNFKEEDMLMFEADRWLNDHMHVSVMYALEGPLTKGWIKVNSAIGIYSRNYASNLILYDRPSAKGEKVVKIKDWINKVIKVIGCNGEWVKVEIEHKGKTHAGWMPPDMQCANPYTTCN